MMEIPPEIQPTKVEPKLYSGLDELESQLQVEQDWCKSHSCPQNEKRIKELKEQLNELFVITKDILYGCSLDLNSKQEDLEFDVDGSDVCTACYQIIDFAKKYI